MTIEEFTKKLLPASLYGATWREIQTYLYIQEVRSKPIAVKRDFPSAIEEVGSRCTSGMQ